MAKKKGKHKEEAHHGHKAHEAKKKGFGWAIGVAAVIVIIILIVLLKKQAPPPVEVQKEAVEPEVIQPEEKPEKLPSDVEVLSEKLREGRATEDSLVLTKGEGKSWFSGIKCALDVGESKSTTAKDDTLDFQLTNQGTLTYTLSYVSALDVADKGVNPMRVQVNGRRIRNIKEACGTEEIKPGEMLTCKGAEVLLRTGQSAVGKELVNKIAAEASDVTTQVLFKC